MGTSKTLVVLAAGRILNMLLAVLTVRIFTGLLSPDEVGRLYLVNSLLGWVNIVLFAGPGMYMNRHILEWQAAGSLRRVLYASGLYLVAAGIAGSCLYFAAQWLGLISTAAPGLIATMLLVAVVASNLIGQSGSAINILERRILAICIGLGGQLAAVAIATYAVLYTGGSSAESWFSGYTIGQGVAALVALYAVWKITGSAATDAPAKPEWREWSAGIPRIWAFSWPIAVLTALYWFQSQGYRFVVANRLGAADLGFFVVAYSVGGTAVIAAESVIHQWIFPHFFGDLAGQPRSESDAIWRRYVGAVVPIFGIISVFCIVCSPFLLRVLTGADFHGAYQYVAWGALAESLRVIVGLFYTGGVGRVETAPMIAPHLAGAVLVLSGAYLLGPYLGLHGVGAAITFSYLIEAALMWWFLDRAMFSRVSGSEIFGLAPFAAAMAGICMLATMFEFERSLLLSIVVLVLCGLMLGFSVWRAVSRDTIGVRE